MASQSLYRKWRSQTFAEIVGQQRVTRTLQNALRTNRLSHAYLFCGPRGVGKTSAARVLAKAVNCHNSADSEPCNSCSICVSISEGRCLDIIEIDAASNRGIDEIRDLREKVNFAPSEASYKFYILDEVHMLTSEAFNALLKTLEEPPNHAVFVLVTTEAHRVPPTILSRCQRFDFHRISLPDLVARLGLICQAEGVEVESGALDLIGRLSTGSLRDAESLLDQLISYCGSTITLADVHTVVGMTGSDAAKDLAAHLVAGDIQSGLRLINQVAGEGVDLRQFCREVAEYLRGMLVLKVGGGTDLLDVTRETLLDMQRLAEKVSADFLIRSIRLFANAEVSQRSSLHVQLPVELAFVEAALPPSRQDDARQSIAAPAARSQAAASRASAEPVRTFTRPMAPSVPRDDRTTPSDLARVGKVDVAAGSVVEQGLAPGHDRVEEDASCGSRRNVPDSEATRELRNVWEKVIEKCGSVDKKVQAILRDCEIVEVADGVAHIEVRYSFHKDQIDDPRNGALVESILSDVLASKVRIKSSLRLKDKKKSVKSPIEDPVVKAAIEFGARIKKVEVVREDAS